MMSASCGANPSISARASSAPIVQAAPRTPPAPSTSPRRVRLIGSLSPHRLQQLGQRVAEALGQHVDVGHRVPVGVQAVEDLAVVRREADA